MLKNENYYIAYSQNSEDRFRASSGGVGTAILRYLLSNQEYGTSITFCYDANLCKYVPKMIYSAQDINVCGSVYQDIDLIRYVKENIVNIKDGIVLVCTPCQVAPIRAILHRNAIKNFIISFCCSGQTTIEGTWFYYKLLGIKKDDVVNMQYRGNGWPSGIQIWLKNGNVVKKDNWAEPWVSVHQSNLFKPKRCLFCKLDMGRNADLNLADPWLDEYKKNEKIGATLCVVTSALGKDVFEKLIASKEIATKPSSYDEYAVAESPNVHKEINLQEEKLYKRRVLKLTESRLYRWCVMRGPRTLRIHLRLLNLIRFVSRKRSLMSVICKIIGKIRNKFRFRYYKKRLGSFDAKFYLGENIVMTDPRCVYLGKSVSIGANTYLGPVTSYAGVAYNPKIIIGEGTWVGKNCSIAAVDKVEIGKHVLFAGHVHITDHSHGYEDISKPVSLQPLISKGPVVIEDDCWLGFNCEILSGVHVGRHSVVAARAVVTKNVPAYSIVAGNPAKVIKRYDKESGGWVRV